MIQNLPDHYRNPIPSFLFKVSPKPLQNSQVDLPLQLLLIRFQLVVIKRMCPIPKLIIMQIFVDVGLVLVLLRLLLWVLHLFTVSKLWIYVVFIEIFRTKGTCGLLPGFRSVGVRINRLVQELVGRRGTVSQLWFHALSELCKLINDYILINLFPSLSQLLSQSLFIIFFEYRTSLSQQYYLNLLTMSDQKQLLTYYQQKIDELYRERLSWLSKFDECASQLKEKQQLMNKAKDHKDKEADVRRHIVHHDIALIDEKINVVKMERENIFNQYEDAQQILKIEELMEEFPEQVEKHLPCAAINSAEIIQNQLNIHNAGKQKRVSTKPTSTIFREQNSVLSYEKYGKESKLKYKPTYEELLRRQMAELKANQEKEMVLLEQQGKKLEKTIAEAKRQQHRDLERQRDIVEQLQKQQKKQEQKHKEIAQRYFDTRRKIKEEHDVTLKENQQLKETLKQLEVRVAEQMRIYEKENKAKQTLIFRKSQDFQEDYKARMRAKEHNLQALRDNYEKMQEVCIEKIQKLEQTLSSARLKLQQTENRRENVVSELRAQLNELEKQDKEERIEKARVEMQMKEKVEAEKRRRQEIKEKAVNEEKRFKKAQMIEEAYRKTTKPKRPKPNTNTKPVKEDSGSEQQDSMDLSQLENIKQQINKLDNIMQTSSKKKQ